MADTIPVGQDTATMKEGTNQIVAPDVKAKGNCNGASNGVSAEQHEHEPIKNGVSVTTASSIEEPVAGPSSGAPKSM